MFKILNMLLEGKFWYIDLFANRVHCANAGIYHGRCTHERFFQAGGGTTSPDHSYFYCDYLHRRIFVDPPIATRDIKRVLVPVDCPMQNPGYKQLMNMKEEKRLDDRNKRWNAKYNSKNSVLDSGAEIGG